MPGGFRSEKRKGGGRENGREKQAIRWGGMQEEAEKRPTRAEGREGKRGWNSGSDGWKVGKDEGDEGSGGAREGLGGIRNSAVPCRSRRSVRPEGYGVVWSGMAAYQEAVMRVFPETKEVGE